jgi:hypothetical protein
MTSANVVSVRAERPPGDASGQERAAAQGKALDGRAAERGRAGGDEGEGTRGKGGCEGDPAKRRHQIVFRIER